MLTISSDLQHGLVNSKEKSMDPLVSIIVPVHNVEKYLERALNSVFDQTYTHVEIIAVNDGSTDQSLAVLTEMAKAHQNLLIINQANQGLGPARNTGLTHVHGKYLFFLDADDFITEDMLMSLVEKAESNSVDLIRFNYAPFIETGFEHQIQIDRPIRALQEDVVYNQQRFLKANIKDFLAPVWLYFIRTEIIMAHDLRFQAIIHEDELYMPLVFEFVSRAMYDSRKYFQRRYRSGSIMTTDITKNYDSFRSRVTIIDVLEKKRKQVRANSMYQRFLRKRTAVLNRGLYRAEIDERLKKTTIRSLKRKYKFKTGFLELIRKAVMRIG